MARRKFKKLVAGKKILKSLKFYFTRKYIKNLNAVFT
jgi:hypothetical protein